MTDQLRRRAVALALAVALSSMALAPAAIASPPAATGLTLATLVDWFFGEWGQPSPDGVVSRTGTQETVPDMDSNGLQDSPSLEPTDGAETQAAGDGDTVPDMDPDG